jgi:uncharacterized membrane protein
MVAVQRSGPTARSTKKETNIGHGERIASAAAGGLLALGGLRMLARRHPLLGLSLAAAGGYLVRRGAVGHCALYQSLGAHEEDAHVLSNPFTRQLRAEHSLTVLRSPEETYKLWREPGNLMRLVLMVERVDQPDERHLHFVARDPDTGEQLEWNSEIIEDRPGELIAWRSSGDTPFTSGRVGFCPATGGRGTIVRLELRYRPSGGVFGAAFAKLRGRSLEGRAREYVWRFKQMAEAGEIATNEGPSGAREKLPAERVKRAAVPSERPIDRVEEASRESFPASDAPAWSSDPAAG